ncbi:hypothetical protein FA15DRAFT_673657 [Coprinopsis marcescibilis]|uniref:TPR-like protein n=1 Tax=Coprinopsis marcescibilis TaxID=230819 RepID=A0A5C3KK31_COPMA|nr:hypothetical protein FA15DRAFT_673657 [Coprinopsis marcescibilis]
MKKLGNLFSQFVGGGTGTKKSAKCTEAGTVDSLSARCTANGCKPQGTLDLPHGKACRKRIAHFEAQIATYRAKSAAGDWPFFGHQYRAEVYIVKAQSCIAKELINIGHFSDALVLVEDALAGHLRLCNEIEEDNWSRVDRWNLRGLAGSLEDYAACLCHLGRDEEALAYIQEAHATYLRLAAEDPIQYDKDLAQSHINLARCLDKCGRGVAAIDYFLGGISIYQRTLLSHSDNNSAGLRELLGNSYRSYAACLTNLGRNKESYTFAELSVREFQHIHSNQTDPTRHGVGLSQSLSQLAQASHLCGQDQEAIAAHKKRIAVHRSLVTKDSARFETLLAWGLADYGDLLMEIGQHADAVTPFQEVIAIRRRRVKYLPSSTQEDELDLVAAFRKLEQCLDGAGKTGEGLDEALEAVTMCRRSILAFQNMELWEPQLSYSLDWQSTCLRALGRLEEAVAAETEAVTVYRSWAKRDATKQEPFSLLLSRLVETLEESGAFIEAARVNMELVEALTKLAEMDWSKFHHFLASSMRKHILYREKFGVDGVGSEESWNVRPAPTGAILGPK